jgi:Domain of unknown function (DUF4332)
MAAHKLTDIKGIDEESVAKFKAAGISNAEDLVARALARAGREALAKEIGVSVQQMNEWVNGVGIEFANLLEDCGVDSCKELQHRTPANLHAKLKQTNDEKKITHHAPTLAQVESWVTQAAALAG